MHALMKFQGYGAYETKDTVQTSKTAGMVNFFVKVDLSDLVCLGDLECLDACIDID